LRGEKEKDLKRGVFEPRDSTSYLGNFISAAHAGQRFSQLHT
jgi:hypothetical protein